jgi:hypothetical protein
MTDVNGHAVSPEKMQKTRETKTSSAPQPLNAGERKTLGGKGHQATCSCIICARIRARSTSGKASKATERAVAHQRRLERKKDKRFGTTPNTKREQRIAKKAMLTGALVGQAVAGARPNIAAAARIAGMDPSQAQRQVRRDGTVIEAFERAGITDDRLAQVAAEGLEAKQIKLIADRDGRVIDAIDMPDHKNRHAFWRDILMAKGVLGRDREDTVAGGGLIIIAPQEVSVVPGHPPACTCQECIDAWNEKTKLLQERATRAMAVQAENRNNSKRSPEIFDSQADEDEDEE